MPFKILIVDDEEDFRKLVTILLKKEHFEIHDAASGHEAFSQFQKWHPDLVITDILMPDGDGIELMRDITKATDHFLPILVVSAFPGADESAIRNNPNFAGYFSKPVSIWELVGAIKKIASKAESAHS